MKKMITLGLIICTSLTSSTMFGMLIRKAHNQAKKFATSQRKYNSHTDAMLMQFIIIKIEHQNSLLEKEIAATQETNQKLDTLIKHMTESSQKNQHRLGEMEEIRLEPQYHQEQKLSKNRDSFYQSKYHEDMDRYHSAKKSHE